MNSFSGSQQLDVDKELLTGDIALAFDDNFAACVQSIQEFLG
jgi:hypothetical protein